MSGLSCLIKKIMETINLNNNNTDPIFLHALVRHFFDKKTTTYGLYTWQYVKWDTVRPEDEEEEEYVERLFTYTFPNKPNTPDMELVPHLLRAAAYSGIHEFKRMVVAALGHQKSIFGRLLNVSIAARLLPGDEGTCVTLDYHLVDPCHIREVIILKENLFDFFKDTLQLDNKTDEELDRIFSDFGCSYRPGEEVNYPNIYFRETEARVHFKVHCEHWYFVTKSKPPADREDKIELYLNTLGETLGEETAIKCMYAFDDTGFACKLTKAEAVKAWRKCLHRVFFLVPDQLIRSRYSSSFERQYSCDMESFSGVDYVNKKRDHQFKRLKPSSSAENL